MLPGSYIVVMIHLHDDISLVTSEITVPLESSYSSYTEYTDSGPRGAWSQHNRVKVIFPTNYDIHARNHQLLLFSFLITSKSRIINDVFDLDSQQVQYAYNGVTAAYRITTVAAKNPVTLPHVPPMFLNNNASNVDNLVGYLVVLNKPFNEGVVILVIEILYIIALFNSVVLTNNILIAGNTTMVTQTLGLLMSMTTGHIYESVDNFLLAASIPILTVEFDAVDASTLISSHFNILWTDYIQQDATSPLFVTRSILTDHTYTPKVSPFSGVIFEFRNRILSSTDGSYTMATSTTEYTVTTDGVRFAKEGQCEM